MAFTCGFFNSENGDRKYNAEQMSAIFDGIIADGVFTTIGDHLAVSAGTGMQVLVGTGKAWFDHTWNVNDAAYPLAIAASDVTLSRIDAIVLETNHSDSVRLNKLRVVQGTVASSPVKPTLTNSEKVHQHPLAWVTVAPGVTQIAASAIENAVGTSACPFVTGIIATTDIDDLFAQWNGEFDEWFDNLKAQLSDNVVANLQRQIDANKTQIQKNWDNTLKKYTKELLGIPDNSVPDDAFMALLVGTNSKAYRITVKYPNGEPAVGFTVGGISALPTTTLVTNSDGMVLGKSTSNSPTITVAKKYDDVKAASVTVTSTGTITDVTITLEWDEPTIAISSSTNKTFNNLSAYCKKVAYLLVGGGGGGGAGYINKTTNVHALGGGGGGGGGYYSSGEVSIEQNIILVVAVGAGGAGADGIGYENPTYASDGGKTSLSIKKNDSITLIDSANGGKYGADGSSNYTSSGDYHLYGGSGGSGFKNGGSGGSGYYNSHYNSNTDQDELTVYSFEDTGHPGQSPESIVFNGETKIISGGGSGGGAGSQKLSRYGENGSKNNNPGGGGAGAGGRSISDARANGPGNNGIVYLAYRH